MSYWSRLSCDSCKAYREGGRPRFQACPDHAIYGEGYEAGFEAAMRQAVLVIPERIAGLGNRFFLASPFECVNGWRLLTPQGWERVGPLGPALGFKSRSEAQAAIATAPRWWPKQPWEVE